MPTLQTSSTVMQPGSQPLVIQEPAIRADAAAPVPHVGEVPQSPLSRTTIQSNDLEPERRTDRNTQPTSLSGRMLARAWPSIIRTVKLFFSAEGKELRHVTGIFFRLGFSMVQVVVIVVLLALAGSKFKSKNQEPWDQNISEFEDCDKLGIWNALWAVRAAFGCGMIVWEWKRYLAKRERAIRRRTADIELATTDLEDPADHQLQWGTEVRGPPENPPVPSPVLPEPAIIHSSPNRVADLGSPSGSRPIPDRAPSSEPPPRRSPRREPRQPPTPGDALFDRMDTFLTATGLIHFVVNHIWLYTSVHTCRVNDPHVWYLGLGIASLGYLIVLELLLIAFIVFVLGPILLLILNLIMLCLGRPVDRHGNVIVRAEIPRMEQSLIEKIPLVVYIPPQEPEAKSQAELNGASEPRESGRNDSENAVGTEETSAAKKTHGASNATSSRPTRTRFAWLSRHGGKSKAPKATMWSDAQLISEGDPRFEKCEHPFVVLDSNRAMCYICLSEFVEPKRKEGVPPASPRPKTPQPATEEGQSSTPHIKTGDETEQDPSSSDVKQAKGKEPVQEDITEATPEATPETEEDLGTPGEPLRLLACGHVFHKHCLDPWLAKTSGRCPVCNRKVEIPQHMQ